MIDVGLDETVTPVPVAAAALPGASLLVGALHEVNTKTDISSIIDVNSVLTKDSSFIIFPSIKHNQGHALLDS